MVAPVITTAGTEDSGYIGELFPSGEVITALKREPSPSKLEAVEIVTATDLAGLQAQAPTQTVGDVAVLGDVVYRHDGVEFVPTNYSGVFANDAERLAATPTDAQITANATFLQSDTSTTWCAKFAIPGGFARLDQESTVASRADIRDAANAGTDLVQEAGIRTELDLRVLSADIVDDRLSTDVDKPLSANQGKLTKDELDNTLARLGLTTTSADWGDRQGTDYDNFTTLTGLLDALITNIEDSGWQYSTDGMTARDGDKIIVQPNDTINVDSALDLQEITWAPVTGNWRDIFAGTGSFVPTDAGWTFGAGQTMPFGSDIMRSVSSLGTTNWLLFSGGEDVPSQSERFETVALLPLPATVNSGSEAIVYNDPTPAFNRPYVAIGPANGVATGWQ